MAKRDQQIKELTAKLEAALKATGEEIGECQTATSGVSGCKKKKSVDQNPGILIWDCRVPGYSVYWMVPQGGGETDKHFW